MLGDNMGKILIKDLPTSNRPRERLIKYGVKNISNEELISIILKTGKKDKSVKILANEILSFYQNIINMKNIEVNSITKIDGIGKVKAIELIAAIELGRRVYYERELNNHQIKCSEDIYDYFYSLMKDLKQETFYVVYLDNKKKIIDKKLLYIGTINSSVAHPREIFKYAYLTSASFIICLHNHPSGDPGPSKEDIIFTENMKKIGNIQNIPLLDHIIILIQLKTLL
jgi:DNA repair protein RadC